MMLSYNQEHDGNPAAPRYWQVFRTLLGDSPPLALLNWVLLFQAGEMSGSVAKWDLRSPCISEFTSVQINRPLCAISSENTRARVHTPTRALLWQVECVQHSLNGFIVEQFDIFPRSLMSVLTITAWWGEEANLAKIKMLRCCVVKDKEIISSNLDCQWVCKVIKTCFTQANS